MRLKVTYSILSAWLNGDLQQVVKMLEGMPTYETEAMRQGKIIHKYFEDWVNDTGNLPPVFGEAPLVKPKTEQYYRVKISEPSEEEIYLSGVLDLQYGENGEVICDYKTGTTPASAYKDSLQTDCYKILRPEAQVFKYLHYNQYTRQSEQVVINIAGDDQYTRSLAEVRQYARDIRLWLKTIMPAEEYAKFDNSTRSSHTETPQEKEQ